MAAIAAASMAASTAHAIDVTLTDANSIARFDLDGTTSNPGPGLVDWVISGTDIMFEENFWFRFGNNPEQSLHQAQYLASTIVSDTNTNPGNDTLNALYDVIDGTTGNGDDFLVDVTWVLRGATGKNSDIAETIVITNNTTSRQEFTFFEYTDFDLVPNIQDDFGIRTNPNAFDVADGFWITETTLTPVPSRWEMKSYPIIRDKLTDGVATTLDNTFSPLGPTDVTWAAQWNIGLNPGASFEISKDKNVSAVPLPAAAWFLLAGVGALGAYGRKRRA
jgi:hypothetical protein